CQTARRHSSDTQSAKPQFTLLTFMQLIGVEQVFNEFAATFVDSKRVFSSRVLQDIKPAVVILAKGDRQRLRHRDEILETIADQSVKSLFCPDPNDSGLIFQHPDDQII